MDEHQVLQDFNIFLLNNARSQAYLQLLIKGGLVPAHRYLLVPPGTLFTDPEPSHDSSVFFDTKEPVWTTLKKHGLSFSVVENVDLNSTVVVEVAKKVPGKFTIYCGGPILEEPILTTPSKFIHCHPGRTPDFKGSTCFYYSLLAEQKMAVTCFFMELGLDEGEIIHQQEFKPTKGVNIDSIFDPWMRAVTLVTAIKSYVAQQTFKPTPLQGDGENYFVIHPVLKSLAIKVAQNHGTEITPMPTWTPPVVSDYEYTKENRIQNVHKYSFSPFGDPFLKCYAEDRLVAMKKLGRLNPSPYQLTSRWTS